MQSRKFEMKSAISITDLYFQVGTPKLAANTTSHGPASRYLAALTPVKKGGGVTVSLGTGSVPSVKQTQRLLLMKTGGLLAGTQHARFKYPRLCPAKTGIL